MKLYYRYSSMSSGKSTQLLQIAHNYKELNLNTLIIKPKLDTRDKEYVCSRIGLKAKADLFFHKELNIYNSIKNYTDKHKCYCVLVDEAQFLTKRQVWQLTDVVDILNIPVIAFGLRTDFQGNLFEGSKWLLAWADDIQEMQTTNICHCGKKARFVLRLDDNGQVVKHGSQILCGGNERYMSVCRKHFKEEKVIHN